jgi:hypothetical protein
MFERLIPLADKHTCFIIGNPYATPEKKRWWKEVTTPDLINSLNHIDDIYIDTVEIYEDGFEMIEQKVPLGDASKCVRNLLQIIQYNDAFDLAANNLALEIKNSVRFHWRQLNPGSSTPEPEFINQFYDEVINRLKTKI